MIDLAEALKIAEHHLRHTISEDSVLPTSFGWFFCSGSVQALLDRHFDERAGIGSSSLIVEKATGAVFSVDSSYSLAIRDVLRAFEAGFSRPRYDIVVTRVHHADTTVECIADLLFQDAAAISERNSSVIAAELSELPKTFAGVDVWRRFDGVARIHETRCCLYYATPTREQSFQLKVTMIHDMDDTVAILHQLRTIIVDSPAAEREAGALAEGLSKEHIRVSLESLPARFSLQRTDASSLAALCSNEACAFVLERVDSVDV